MVKKMNSRGLGMNSTAARKKKERKIILNKHKN
jgi:hypothetical protein